MLKYMRVPSNENVLKKNHFYGNKVKNDKFRSRVHNLLRQKYVCSRKTISVQLVHFVTFVVFCPKSLMSNQLKTTHFSY